MHCDHKSVSEQGRTKYLKWRSSFHSCEST
jgi:hypothetical protein